MFADDGTHWRWNAGAHGSCKYVIDDLTRLVTDIPLLRRLLLRLEGSCFPNRSVVWKRGLRDNGHLRVSYFAYRLTYHERPPGIFHHVFPRHHTGHQFAHYRYILLLFDTRSLLTLYRINRLENMDRQSRGQ